MERRTYVVCRREAKQRPSIAPLGRAKGDCPRDCESNAVIERDIESTIQAFINVSTSTIGTMDHYTIYEYYCRV